MTDFQLWTPRLAWQDLPAALRYRIAEGLHAEIRSVRGTVGGFSTGFAGLVETDESTVFIKSTSASLNAHGHELYRRERANNELLAPLGVGPQLLLDVQWRDWTALGFQAVNAPACDPSWPADQLDGVLRQLREHVQAAPAGLPPAHRYLGDAFDSWSAIARAAGSDPWCPRGRNGRQLLDEARWLTLAGHARRVSTGDDLLHADLRSDNVLWHDGQPVLIDWAYACSGAAVVDPVYLLLDAAHRRGEFLDRELDRELAAHGSAPVDGTALLAAFAGWFTGMAGQPPPPGLPTLRGFQAGMAATATQWAAARDTR